MEIPDDIYEKVCDLCESGNLCSEQSDHSSALIYFQRALSCLPEPKPIWDAYGWIKISIGDSLFFLRRYDEVADCFFEALDSVDGEDNPFVMLRLGQSLDFLGRDGAVEYLCKAYVLGGLEVFENEDAKYIDLVHGSQNWKDLKSS